MKTAQRVVFISMLFAIAGRAQIFNSIHTFQTSDGTYPGSAVLGPDGNFYGITTLGGTSGDGTIFRITPAGVLTTTHTFTGPDGVRPAGLTLGTDGNFYGTTSGANATSSCLSTVSVDCGSAFKVTPSGVFTTLAIFGSTLGQGPNTMTEGPDGNFYGGTELAGNLDCPNSEGQGCGTLFQVTPAGVLTILHTFGDNENDSDGSNPLYLTLGADGYLYGTTASGGSAGCVDGGGCGTIFKTSISGAFTTLHAFIGTDGSYPSGAPVQSPDGNFYGSTIDGGTVCGCGIVYKMTPAGTVTTLFSFDGSDGEQPRGGLTLGTDGNFYGVTSNGITTPAGTIYSITPAGVFTNLHNFDGLDGNLGNSLVLGAGGVFYATSYDGGSIIDGNGIGTFYSLQPCAPGVPACAPTTITSSPNPSAYGDPVTLTAVVKPAVGSGTPTGTITFTEAGMLLGKAAMIGGSATLTTGALGVALSETTATYSGDANFQPSNQDLVQVVTQSTTTTAVTSNLNPSTYFQAVTLQATVTPAHGGTATGNVVFQDGSKPIGSATVSGNQAAVTLTSLAVGTHAITASYSGDANCKRSTGSITQTVDTATSSETLRSSAPTVFVSQSVTFSVVVTGEYGGNPTGTVTFYENGVAIGSPVSVASRQASITTSFAAPGSYSITAIYSGDANYHTSSAPAINQVVDNTSTTTTSLKTSGSPSLIGQKVTFTATVKPSLGSIPNGETVTFLDGSLAIGTGTTVSGVATFSTSSLAAGSHLITAAYSGDKTYQASTSASVNQVISKNATTTLLMSGLNPSVYGQSVTFTAKVTAADSPTGSVAFKNGATGIGSVALSGGIATFTTKTLPVGTDSITAIYTGDASNANSTSTAVNEVVKQAATTTVLTSSKNPSALGQSVTFVVTVSSANATPSGTVILTNGSVNLGTITLAGGKGSLATTTLPEGADVITATYQASVDFTGSSASLTQTVN